MILSLYLVFKNNIISVLFYNYLIFIVIL